MNASLPSFVCKKPALVFFSLLVLSVTAYCGGAGWPEGFSVAEDSVSPDGRFGALIPSREKAGDMDEDTIQNFLAEIPTHRKLAAIRGAHYFSGENHRDLHVAWAGDSSWAVVTYDGRYGFENITAIDMRGSKCLQTDIGSHIQKALNSAISRQTGDQGSTCYGAAHFRSGASGEILVRATGLTNPKCYPTDEQLFALFQGTFNPASGKWTRSEAQKIESIDDMETAFSGSLDEGITFATEENRLAWYDDRLNEVYGAVRVILPAGRFAKVKKEQIAWLKKLEATEQMGQKSDLIGARIQELQKLVW
ncbi:MAG: hypothetical protein D4R65_04555 [Verrucomicrobiaceae bacterium]|nr:MAG: hypothetical protein D4R65_04555 [Verrucomicrobiaceae bacterium]